MPDNTLQPVDMFEEMFKKHLESTDYNLSINNFVLLRNVFKLAAKGELLDEAEKKSILEIEERWGSLNKGCSCTKSKRTDEVIKVIVDFALSERGRAIFVKIKPAFKLNTLNVDIPEPPVKYEI